MIWGFGCEAAFFQVSLQVLSRSLALSSFIYFDKVQTNEVHPASHWKMKEGGQGEMEPTERKGSSRRKRGDWEVEKEGRRIFWECKRGFDDFIELRRKG